METGLCQDSNGEAYKYGGETNGINHDINGCLTATSYTLRLVGIGVEIIEFDGGQEMMWYCCDYDNRSINDINPTNCTPST
jgi:hypothetical protein